MILSTLVSDSDSPSPMHYAVLIRHESSLQIDIVLPGGDTLVLSFSNGKPLLRAVGDDGRELSILTLQAPSGKRGRRA